MVDAFLNFLTRCGVLVCSEQILFKADPLSADITVIHKHASFQGDIITEGDVLIFGAYSGSINASYGSVYLYPGSSSKSLVVKCKYLEVRGNVTGMKARTAKFVFDGEDGSIAGEGDTACRIEYEQMSLRNADNFDAELKRVARAT